MYSLNLSQDMEQCLAFLAKETGRDKDNLMQEALSRGIQDLIEDLEDITDAKKVLQSSSKQWTLEQVEARLVKNQRLKKLADEIGNEAKEKGLTPEILQDILNSDA